MGAMDHYFLDSYLKRWINNVTHSTVLPNVYIRLEGIGPVMIPMPVPIDSAYKDGVIRCDFTDVDPELLADYGWFKELVIWKQVPALKDQEFTRQKDDLTMEIASLTVDNQALETEITNIEERNTGREQQLAAEKNTTFEAVVGAEKDYEKLGDIRASLENGNAAMSAEIDALQARFNAIREELCGNNR